MYYTHMLRYVFPLVLTLLIPVLASAQPALVFEEESHDFGVLSAGTTAEHAFVFTNTGTEDLVIQKILTS